MAPPEVKIATVILGSPDTIHLVSTALEPIEGDEVQTEVKVANHDMAWFLQAMANRMTVSFHKYGSFDDVVPTKRRALDQIEQRIQKYIETGNVEWLIDAANYCYMEFTRPCLANAHFRATDSDESPGAINIDGSVSHGKD